MSDQHEDHGVEDLDVPESESEHVVGGIIAVRKAGGQLKIDRAGLKIDGIHSYGG